MSDVFQRTLPTASVGRSAVVPTGIVSAPVDVNEESCEAVRVVNAPVLGVTAPMVVLFTLPPLIVAVAAVKLVLALRVVNVPAAGVTAPTLPFSGPENPVAVIVPAEKLPEPSRTTTLPAVLAVSASTAQVVAAEPLKLLPVRYVPRVSVSGVAAVMVAVPPREIVFPFSVIELLASKVLGTVALFAATTLEPTT